MSEKFVLATHNPSKLREMREILSELGVEVVSPEEAGVTVDVEEIGVTFAENAMLKAKVICSKTGLPAIGDDSGLCVNALNGGPGVYSARYGGENLTDAQRNQLLLQSVKGQGTRDAHFMCSIACAFPNGDTLTAEGRCDGVISYIPLGTDGFGYDPVFNYPPKLKTFAQMTPEEKAEVSHRGKALRAFAETLGAYLSERAWKELEAEKESQSGDEEAPESAEAVATAEASENAETVEMAETPEGAEAVETAQASEGAETVEAAEASENAETVETAQASENAETVETAQAPEDAETVEKAQAPEDAETVETAETPKKAQAAPQSHKRHKKKRRKKHH